MQATVLSRNPISFAGSAKGLEKFFELEHWRVNVDGREDDRIIWQRGEFVFVVAITPQKAVVLIREYKQAVEQTILCLPAGRIKKNETAGGAGQRELLEETGYAGREDFCHVFGPFFNSPDKSTERHYVVLVLDAVRQGDPAPEESETILGVQLCELAQAKSKLFVGMNRMAVDVAEEFMKNQ